MNCDCAINLPLPLFFLGCFGIWSLEIFSFTIQNECFSLQVYFSTISCGFLTFFPYLLSRILIQLFSGYPIWVYYFVLLPDIPFAFSCCPLNMMLQNSLQPCQGLPCSQITKVDVHAAGEVTPGGLRLWPVQPSLQNKEKGGVHVELRAGNASCPLEEHLVYPCHY